MTDPGYIYVILAPDGSRKIGKSKHPEARIKQIASGHPGFRLELTYYTQNMSFLEGQLHTVFRYQRLGVSEFFKNISTLQVAQAILVLQGTSL